MKFKAIYSVTAALALLVVAFLFIFSRNQDTKERSDNNSRQQRAIDKKYNSHAPRVLDSTAIVTDLKFFASDSCEGRAPGTIGHQRAKERIVRRFRESGVGSFNDSLTQVFTGRKINNSNAGSNIIGWVKGRLYPDSFIVITAHYDHLGKIGNKIYYGASDNASGTACLLSLAKYYQQNPLPISLAFVAFDREETGLEGALYFADHLPAPIQPGNIKLNLNLDMLARTEKNEIFACGTSHYPAFTRFIHAIQNKTSINLLTGHDTGNDYNDWTRQSDHFAFHRKNIPFLYLGVEDHMDYHKPGDTSDKIDLRQYIEICNMVVLLINAIAQ